MLEDPIKREEFLVFLRNSLPPEVFRDPKYRLQMNLLRHDDNALIEGVRACTKLLYKRLGKLRMYCLTPVPDSMLMWSHYSDRHRGICLEFDKDSDLIGMGHQVRYRDTYPELLPQTAKNDLLELVLTKSKDWSYEKEFRIIASSLEGPTKLCDEFVLLPEGALTGIILGCECTNQLEILSIVKDHCPSIAVKQMVRVPNHYKLTIQE